MRSDHHLTELLRRLDGRSYGEYKELRGDFDFGDVIVSIDKVQTDPYAPPSLMRAAFDIRDAAIPSHLIDDREGRIATADFLTRAFEAAIGNRAIGVGRAGQEVLERTNMLIAPDFVEARLSVQLPAAGRRIKGREAERLLTRELPAAARAGLLYENLDHAALAAHVALYRDQQALRRALRERGLVAFVGDGAILPRRSGDSDLPLARGAVPFTSPDSLRCTFELPSGRTVTGMGVPVGITVIVGGGYHGKSTLLRALERGVYPHIAGDGREWVLTVDDAAAIRAEDGRAVTGVDISPFISGLPAGADTRDFSTTNASGSTSQAANLVEAVTAGTSALLIDEDTSATNFMIRDERMRELIPADREPITPFVDRIRPLYEQAGVSTVLVAGGSGAFFAVADTVVAMDAYVPAEVTARAREIAAAHAERPAPGEAAARGTAIAGLFATSGRRVPVAGALEPADKRKPARARGLGEIQLGRESIDMSAVGQLLDAAQTAGVAAALERLSRRFDGRVDALTAIAELAAELDAEGLDALAGGRANPGHLTRPRIQEIHAALCRYRGLRLSAARQ